MLERWPEKTRKVCFKSLFPPKGQSTRLGGRQWFLRDYQLIQSVLEPQGKRELGKPRDLSAGKTKKKKKMVITLTSAGRSGRRRRQRWPHSNPTVSRFPRVHAMQKRKGTVPATPDHVGGGSTPSLRGWPSKLSWPLACLPRTRAPGPQGALRGNISTPPGKPALQVRARSRAS